MAGLLCLTTAAQPRFSLPHGLYDEKSLNVTIEPGTEGAEVRYTTDGSMPTAKSKRYTSPLKLTATTILRAVDVKDGVADSITSTASYIFVN